MRPAISCAGPCITTSSSPTRRRTANESSQQTGSRRMKKTSRREALASMIAGSTALLAASAMPAGTALADEEKINVTFIIYTAAGDPFWNPVIHGAEEAAKDRGVSVDIQYADSDP